MPVTMIARLEYLLAHMEMTEENLEKLATELAFCAEVNVLFKLDPGKICTAVPEWLKAHGYVKPDGTFFKEHLWFFKNGYNALVYDYGVMRGEELTKEKFSRYYDKLKFYTIESPWFKCRINDEMMEAFLLEQKESKN